MRRRAAVVDLIIGDCRVRFLSTSAFDAWRKNKLVDRVVLLGLCDSRHWLVGSLHSLSTSNASGAPLRRA